jgi:hypothetical protein
MFCDARAAVTDNSPPDQDMGAALWFLGGYPDSALLNWQTGLLDGATHEYWVKSNSISSMSTQGGSASFSSKTNVYEIVNGSNNGIDGGGVMTFTFTPAGQTGTLTTSSGASQAFTCPSTPSNGRVSVIVYKSTGGRVVLQRLGHGRFSAANR